MLKSPMSAREQAVLQEKLFKLLGDHKLLYGTSTLSLFYFLIAFAWGYVRREGETNEAIKGQMVHACDRCEAAYKANKGPGLVGHG